MTSPIDRILRELVDLHDARLALRPDDFDARAAMSWRRHELHAEAARIARIPGL